MMREKQKMERERERGAWEGQLTFSNQHLHVANRLKQHPLCVCVHVYVHVCVKCHIKD